MKNQVIKVLNVAHGAKVIEYWNSKGINTNGYFGDAIEEGGHSYIYYGIIDGTFDNYTLKEVKEKYAEIIQLPEERTFPRKMQISNNGLYWDEREVIFFSCGMYFTKCDTNDWAKGFLYAKEIDEQKRVELTVSQLFEKTSEIKKIFGLSESDELVIKM